MNKAALEFVIWPAVYYFIEGRRDVGRDAVLPHFANDGSAPGRVEHRHVPVGAAAIHRATPKIDAPEYDLEQPRHQLTRATGCECIPALGGRHQRVADTAKQPRFNGTNNGPGTTRHIRPRRQQQWCIGCRRVLRNCIKPR